MTNEETKQLCMNLLLADEEEEVIRNLQEAGYWDDPNVWRLYGDRNGNFATIGNQQSRPEAALVEKIINSVDARLMNECLCAGVDPTSSHAPQNLRAAVAEFFEGRKYDGDYAGALQHWAAARRTEEATNITLACTGGKRNPCLTLVDTGEGQLPDHMPDTFLSIDRDNKLRIPFVQGKFNMGGTGALKFCGNHRLQLLITRRNPAIVSLSKDNAALATHWGFTVVRRETPSQTSGAIRNSVYTFLAPTGIGGAVPRGRVLSFEAESLPLMPEYNQPYVRVIEWGSVIKLYNYDMKGFSSHILMKDGLLFRLEILLPEIALPVSLHECRDFRGKAEASFVTTLSGLTVRLEEGRGKNLEAGFPCSVPFSVNGQPMTAKIYAFKKGRAETYRTNEGVIFTINGQTHGAIPKTIFQRNAVKMGRLADSLLVMVDCSKISVVAREDLFMNSRDRLSAGELRKAVESQLEDILHKHPGLRKLREERRSQEIAERLADSKPLEDILDSILKSSPSLAALFLQGQRLPQPHKRQAGQQDGPRGGGPGDGDQPFVGQPHPTYFRFAKKNDGQMLERNCDLGRRCRLTFETDVENEYFSRLNFPGRYSVEKVGGRNANARINHSLTLHDGFAHWSLELPDDLVVGDKLTLRCHVTDDVIGDGFVNVAELTVTPQTNPPGGRGERRSHQGQGDDRGHDQPVGLRMPHIERVTEEQWDNENKFDRYSACKVVQDEEDDAVDDAVREEEDHTSYTFYINVDNVFLRTDMKQSRDDPKLIEAKFLYGNVLVGLAMIHDEIEREKQRKTEQNGQDEREDVPIEEQVSRVTRALAPFIVPMINYLGGLTSEEIASVAEVGDQE